MKWNRIATFMNLSFICIAAGLLGLAAEGFGAVPWLHVEGNQIKDPQGNVVVLRGISMIDLGFTEGWQGGVINMLDRITDTTDTQGNSPGWYPKVVRIPVAPPDAVDNWPYPFDPDNDILYNLLRTAVDYLAAKDIYVIIDWHYVDNTWEHVDSTSQFWSYMAPRFANDSNVIFELFNEPVNDVDGDWIFNSNDTADWLSVRQDMQTWIDVVRTWAPNNLILVGGAFYCQLTGPAADYPLSDPVGGNNIAMVSHLYPAHWQDAYWSASYRSQITACRTVYPVMMTEWGFSSDYEHNDDFDTTIADYGQPLMDFLESLGIGNTAWCASYDWGPPMFYPDWTLRVGDGEMGGFVKDTLYLKRNSDQPGGGGDTEPPDSPTGLQATSDEAGIHLSWDAHDDPNVYGYHVYRALSAGGDYTRISGTMLTLPSFTDTDVIGGLAYYYAATAIDTFSNESDYSQPVLAVGVHAGIGSILRQWWSGIEGSSVGDLTGNADYPHNPSGSELLLRLEGPSNWNNAYGSRIRGYLYPPQTGDYTFWIAGDDNCQLWLSTDGTPDQAVLIADVPGWTDARVWDKYASQQSAPVPLTGGRKYYIEVLHKEGTGGDHVAVAWSGPGMSRNVIDGMYLSPPVTGFYADRNGDGAVTVADLVKLAELWLQDDCAATAGTDLNGDCVVDFYEYARMANTWTETIE